MASWGSTCLLGHSQKKLKQFLLSSDNASAAWRIPTSGVLRRGTGDRRFVQDAADFD
jgi:hypothetical protein